MRYLSGSLFNLSFLEASARSRKQLKQRVFIIAKLCQVNDLFGKFAN